MLRIPLSVLTLLALLAPVPVLAQDAAPAAAPGEAVTLSSDPSADVVRRVRAMMAEELEQANLVVQAVQQAAGAEPQTQDVAAAQVDLTGDGVAEIVGQGLGSYFCGSAGCQTFIYFYDGQGWRQILDVNLQDLRLLPGSTNGFRDLLVNGDALWQYQNGAYDFVALREGQGQ